MLMFENCYSKRKQKIDPVDEALDTLQDLILKQNPPIGDQFSISKFNTKGKQKVDPIAAALNTLQDLILKQDPPKGEEFSKIPGPVKNEKVCIVGAGPSGVYTAMKLKKLGYQDVTIYEKSFRVGGKSYNVEVRGASYPLGTIFVEPNYFENIVPLAREYDAGDLIGTYDNDSMVGFWATNNAATGEITRVAWYLSQLSQFTNSDDPLINIAFLVTKIIKYIRYIHETRQKVLKVGSI